MEYILWRYLSEFGMWMRVMSDSNQYVVVMYGATLKRVNFPFPAVAIEKRILR
jgi:hypothetical protein